MAPAELWDFSADSLIHLLHLLAYQTAPHFASPFSGICLFWFGPRQRLVQLATTFPDYQTICGLASAEVLIEELDRANFSDRVCGRIGFVKVLDFHVFWRILVSTGQRHRGAGLVVIVTASGFVMSRLTVFLSAERRSRARVSLHSTWSRVAVILVSTG